MSSVPRVHAIRRMHAATGAPLLLLGWVSALVVGFRLLRGASSPLDWLPSHGPLLVWWSIMVLGVVAHMGARLRLRGTLEDGADAADAEGHGLRIGAGACALVAGLAVLGLVAWVVFGGHSATDGYAVVDQALSGLVGVGLACFLGAGGGLYLAEEIPRAAVRLGVTKTERAVRGTRVLCILIAIAFFAASVNFVSHFSVGRALLSAAAGGAP